MNVKCGDAAEYECPTIPLCGHRRPEPEKGGGHIPPPALTRPALFALTLLSYDLTPLALWPPSQVLVLAFGSDLSHTFYDSCIHVVHKVELMLSKTYLNTKYNQVPSPSTFAQQS